MLPIPDTTVWSSSWRLISECLRRNTVTTPSRLKSRVQRIAGDMGDGYRHIGAVDGDKVGQQPAAERALVDEAERGAVVEQRRDPQVPLVGHGAEQHLPTHTEMDHQR